MELDPLNAAAAALLVKAQDKVYDTRVAVIRDEYDFNFRRQRQEADARNVPYSSYLEYPSNWKEISQRQGQEFHHRADEPWKEEIRKKLRKPVSFEFVDTPLVDAIKFLDTQTHVTIILDPKAVADGADKTAINLRVQDMELEQALKWILRLAELEYDLRNQAVFITKKADATTNVELEIYDIRDLTTAITDFPGPRIDVGTAGTNDAAGGNPFQAPPAQSGFQASDLAQLIKEKILASEFADPAFSIEENGGKLVVLQRPEVHERIRQLLRSFRETQTIQVLTQVRFIDSTDDFLEQIGVSLTGLDLRLATTHGRNQSAGQSIRCINRHAMDCSPTAGGPGLPAAPGDGHGQFDSPSSSAKFHRHTAVRPCSPKNVAAAAAASAHWEQQFPECQGNTTFGRRERRLLRFPLPDIRKRFAHFDAGPECRHAPAQPADLAAGPDHLR